MSMIIMSALNLARMRPDGMDSNHDRGAFNKLAKQSPCTLLEAMEHT